MVLSPSLFQSLPGCLRVEKVNKCASVCLIVYDLCFVTYLTPRRKGLCAQEDRCQWIKVKPSKRWKLKDGVEFSIFVGSTSMLMNWIIILCIVSSYLFHTSRENRYVIYESSLKPILRITHIRVTSAFVILYTRVRGLLRKAFLTTATPRRVAPRRFSSLQ